MKKVLLSGLLCILSTVLFAQNCYRIGTFVGAGDVDVKGSVTLEVQANGEIKLTLSSDFISDAGPDLDIYLGSSDRVDTYSLKIDALGSLTGGQSYTISSAVGIDDYNYVSIHCTQYNHHYGAAQLGAKQGNCSTLSVQPTNTNNLKASLEGNTLNIEAGKALGNASIQVFDLGGSLLFQQTNASLNSGVTAFNLASLSGGAKVVLCRISSNTSSLSTKLYYRP